MEFIIEDYKNDYYDEVKKLLIDSFPEVNELLNEGLTDKTNLDLDKSRYIQLVAKENNKIIGYALASKSFDPIMKKTNLWIDYVCVNPDFRGKGIARKLLSIIEDRARKENVLFMQLTSSKFRTGARKLYQDFGFSIRESDIFRKVLK